MRFTRILRAIAQKDGFSILHHRKRGPGSAYMTDGISGGMYQETFMCPALVRWEQAKEGAIDYVDMDGYNQINFVIGAIGMVLFYYGVKEYSDMAMRKRGVDPDIVRSQHSYIYGGNGWLARQEGRRFIRAHHDYSPALKGKWGNDGDQR